MKRRGMTLVELVIVLGALTILVSILSPLFIGHSRPHPVRSQCQQNMRQVGLAIKQYLSDNNENFPMVKSGGEFYGWADAVTPYLKDSQVFQCPTDDTWPGTGHGPLSLSYTDYFYNSRLEGINESSLQYIANTVMLGDAVPGDARQHSTGGSSLKPGIARLVNHFGEPIGAAMRHLEGGNYTFGDGHTKWMKGQDVITTPAIRNASGGTSSSYPTFAIY